MPVVAGGEGEGSTIRRQTKKAKTDAAVAAVPAGPPDKARMNKEVVKGVLASPLIVPWSVTPSVTVSKKPRERVSY